MRKSRRPGPVTAAFDRGPAKYFHGRKQILRDFSELVERATQADSGTTFLIQGPPGAGKTALLAECASLAQGSRWKIVDIAPPALWNPNELQQSLKPRRNFKVEGGSAGIRFFSFGQAEIKAGRFPQTMQKLLRKGRTPLLLTLDEAQILGKKDTLPPDQAHTASSILNAIHNGKLDKPVILLAAGLGPTTKAFESFGISRFEGDARVELGALGKEAERAVLYDWLTKDGKATGDTTTWIDAIAKETHGWPQHILSYVKPALKQLRADKRAMTAEGLATVLETGRARRAAYYKQRAEGFSTQQRRSFAKLFTNVSYGESLELEDIMMSLAQDHGADKAQEIFRRAEEKGIVDERDGRYAVPIPSMHDWLVSNYAHTQEKEMPSKLIGQSQEQRSSTIVTKKSLDQEISTQTLRQLRDIEKRDSGMDFGR